ncbi:condensation domain-containing protein [Moorena producens JHB]|uniref:Phthiocerol/phthiodiolone dimycocerosyl transferase n=2 Tax=Cyanophyceae TaxID=3028117 RepID=A0A1D9GBD0_MOOP1|nr:condensation domain-containing protein [Moorena producens]AOY84948.2 condensation domain-containing protein [Moorena producens JHB]
MIDNRKLCASEQAMEILNRLTRSSNVVVIGRILSPLSEEIVRQALDLIQDHHARLHSRIVGDVDNLRFETGAKKIPLRVVEKQYEGQWQETVLEELNTQIESSEVLLRAVLVQEQELGENSASHLIITIHHAITDALSSIQLYSELLSYCSKVASGEPLVPVSRLPVLPSMDELFPPSTKGFRSTISILLSLLRLQFKLLWHRPENLGIEKSVPLELRRCGNVYRHLDADFTQQLVNCCRQEKTTVQGALCAAMMFAAGRKIRPEQKTGMSCRSYIDLRKYLKPVVGNEHMGTLISGVTSFHTLGTNTSFWELARDVTQQLEVGLKRDDIFIEMLLLRKITEVMISRPSQVPLTVGLSNVGRVNIPRVYGQFELSEISFLASQATLEGCVIAFVTTFEGKMFLHFAFSVPAISQETMETVVDSVVSCLVDANKGKI